jgi:hypothetical protein
LAVVRLYGGRPVKRIQKLSDSTVRLIFYGPVAGQPGLQLTVTAKQWEAHGKKTFFLDEDATQEKLRELAAKTASLALPPSH